MTPKAQRKQTLYGEAVFYSIVIGLFGHQKHMQEAQYVDFLKGPLQHIKTALLFV